MSFPFVPGHEVVGVTMKLWGGDSDTGCCSVSDVDDARRVAQQAVIARGPSRLFQKCAVE
mgnify:CR=1 FL=1